jgi:hypothetical protein
MVYQKLCQNSVRVGMTQRKKFVWVLMIRYVYIYLVQVYQTHGYCIVLLSNDHDREWHSMRACETQKTMGLETCLLGQWLAWRMIWRILVGYDMW